MANENDDLTNYYEEPDRLQPMLESDEDYTHGRPLMAFTGPSDLPKEENRRWFMLVMTASVLLILVALLINKVLLAIILIGVAWLTYMLTRLPNQEIENIVTTTGFFTQNKFFPWSQLNGFWIIKDHGHYVLGLETTRRAFSNVMILLGSQNPLEVRQVLAQYIPYREDRKQDTLNLWMERSAELLDNFYAKIGRSAKNYMSDRRKAETKRSTGSPVTAKPAPTNTPPAASDKPTLPVEGKGAPKTE